MRVIIAGSRDINLLKSQVQEVVDASGFELTTLVCGVARGVDMCGHAWAFTRHIPIDKYPALWEEHGKSAGYKRNVQMADNADALIAVMKPGGSKGTQHMIDIAQSKGLRVFIKEWS